MSRFRASFYFENACNNLNDQNADEILITEIEPSLIIIIIMLAIQFQTVKYVQKIHIKVNKCIKLLHFFFFFV